MISVSHLTRRFSSFTAVDDISFRLEKGEVVGFLGPNGAGKTTTMRMLTGFVPASRGTIEVAGFNVLHDSLRVRQEIGYLPEAVPLYREHRVEEMLLLQGRLHGLSRAEGKRRVPAVLERVGLLERRRSLIGKLSKGQRQRIGLAVALLPDPQVLILDEPTSGLDPLQRIEVRSLVRDLAQDRTVLLSSHILPEIEAVCPRVIIMHRGRIAADGTPSQLIRELGGETFVRVEAVLGDVQEARRLLGGLPGVRRVDDRGRVGIHHGLELYGDEDVREDVGALAAQRGWALRELSWHEPTLERVFSRIALDLEHEGEPAPPAPSPASQAEVPLAAQGDRLLSLAPSPSGSDESHMPAEGKLLYNLNPFDGGAGRDLSAPKRNAPAPPPGSREPEEPCS